MSEVVAAMLRSAEALVFRMPGPTVINSAGVLAKKQGNMTHQDGIECIIYPDKIDKAMRHPLIMDCTIISIDIHNRMCEMINHKHSHTVRPLT